MAKTATPFLFLLLAAAAAAAPSSGFVGGWSKIKDPSAPQIQDVARFAVDEHNKGGPPALSYVSVASGESQVVAGMNYRLQILATDPDGATRLCEAVVWEKLWESPPRVLTSFRIVS